METWILLTLGSALLFGVKDLFARKYLAHHDVQPIELTLQNYVLFFLGTVIFFFPLINFTGVGSVLHWIALKSVLAIIIITIYFYLLEHYEVSQVAPIINTSPAVLIFFSFMFLGEVLSAVQVAGILVIIFGTYVLHLAVENRGKEVYHKHGPHFKDPRFLSLASIMILALGIIPIAEKKVLAVVNLGTNIFFSAVIVVLLITVYLMYKKRLVSSFLDLVKNPKSLLVSMPHTLSDFLVIAAIAVPTAYVSLIIPLRRLSTLISSIAGGFLFHENHLKIKLLATAIMLFGVFLIFA